MTKQEYELRLIIKAMISLIVMEATKKSFPDIGEAEIEETRSTLWDIFVEDFVTDK